MRSGCAAYSGRGNVEGMSLAVRVRRSCRSAVWARTGADGATGVGQRRWRRHDGGFHRTAAAAARRRRSRAAQNSVGSRARSAATHLIAVDLTTAPPAAARAELPLARYLGWPPPDAPVRPDGPRARGSGRGRYWAQSLVQALAPPARRHAAAAARGQRAMRSGIEHRPPPTPTRSNLRRSRVTGPRCRSRGALPEQAFAQPGRRRASNISSAAEPGRSLDMLSVRRAREPAASL